MRLLPIHAPGYASSADLLEEDSSYLETLRRAGGAESPESEDDLGAFGWLRGQRERAIMLELRHKDGRITGLGYAWLDRAEFNPSEGITLYFLGKTVRLTGSSLNAESRPNVRLFAGLVRHRVPWIQEADQAAAMRAGKGATVIERIEVK